MSSKSNGSVLIRERHKEITQTEEEKAMCEERGTGWSDGATKQPPEALRSQEQILALEPVNQADTLISAH